MKTLALFLALFFACATVKPVWDAGKQCTVAATMNQVDTVVPKLMDVLACAIASGGSAVPACALAGVEQVAREFGEDVLLCALSEIASRKGAEPGSDAAVISQRAKAIYNSRTK